MSNLLKFLTACLTLLFFASPVLSYPGNGSAPANGTSKAADSPFSGTVVETMESGGYTYCLLDNGTQKNWAAIPKTELTVGEDIQIRPGMPMQNFSSKTLNRTFPLIYFSQGVVSN